MAEDMRAYGASEAEIERWLDEAEENEDTVALPEDCRLAVVAFLQCDTQWRRVVAGSSFVAIGLDYAGVRAGLEMGGVAVTPALFADLQFMEKEALVAMNER